MAQKRTMLSSICLSTGSALIQVSIKSVSPQMKQNLHLFPHAPLKELIDNVPVYSPARMFLITCIVLLHTVIFAPLPYWHLHRKQTNLLASIRLSNCRGFVYFLQVS